jgi:hypothetical protein
MRQVVSLIKDNQAHFALVDDEDGSLVPFADLLIPDPDRFGLHESALLGTNLITALGLNGHKRPKAQTISLATVPPTQRQTPEPEALPPVRESAAERRRRLAREYYHRNKNNKQHSVKNDNKAQRFVSIDEVMAVVNRYPEGIRITEVAERLWRETDGAGTDDDYPDWFYTSISNRLTAARLRLRDKGIPLPFREEDRPVPSKDGMHHGNMGKYLSPLPQRTALTGATTEG